MNSMLKVVPVVAVTLAYAWLINAASGTNANGWVGAMLSFSCLAVLGILLVAFYLGSWNESYSAAVKTTWTALAVASLFGALVLYLALIETAGPNDMFWFNATLFGSWAAACLCVFSIYLMGFGLDLTLPGFMGGVSFITINLVIAWICVALLPPFIPRPLVPVIWLISTIAAMVFILDAMEEQMPALPVVNNDD